jgi:hypothetical protein
VDPALGALLTEHVERYNAGVASGDFGPLVELFADDGELRFEGVPAGPYAGREAIAAAYAAQPPTEQLDVLDVRTEVDGTLVEGVAWRSRPGARAAELKLTVRDGRIAVLTVAFL